jgi:hypothetical protein
MGANDRRIVPRKAFTMPIRFVVLGHDDFSTSERSTRASASDARNRKANLAQPLVPHEGETVNLSERGVAFKSQQLVTLGMPIELFFTLPTELTGRIPEDVRCTARVVHVDRHSDTNGNIRVGATIERFERIAPVRSWGN